MTPEQAKQLGIEMRIGASRPTLESEYEVNIVLLSPQFVSGAYTFKI